MALCPDAELVPHMPGSIVAIEPAGKSNDGGAEIQQAFLKIINRTFVHLRSLLSSLPFEVRRSMLDVRSAFRTIFHQVAG